MGVGGIARLSKVVRAQNQDYDVRLEFKSFFKQPVPFEQLMVNGDG